MHSLTIICSITIFLFLLSDIHCNENTNVALVQQLINHMAQNQQEKILQSLLQNSNEGRQDNSNWCCSIDPGKQASSQTRQITYSVQRHARKKCGYNSCGLFGWSSCSKWCDEYWTELQYGVETYLVYEDRLCPVTNLVCCTGYISIINHCFSYDEVLNNKDVLEMLVSLGIPINPTMG